MATTNYASWHPAFMPNTAKDLAILLAAQSKFVPSIELLQPSQHTQEPSEVTEVDVPSQQEQEAEEESIPDQSEALESSLPQLNEDHIADEGLPVTIIEEAEEEEEEEDEEELESGIRPVALEDNDFEATTPSRFLGGKHFSTSPFARTADGSNFFDREIDAEWDLNPPRLDPWRNMAQTRRTNSFPNVPPLHDPSQFDDDGPFSSEGEYMLKAEEQEPKDLFEDDDVAESSFFADEALAPQEREVEPQDPLESAFVQGPSFDEHPLGGHVHTQQDEASEARFEEGLPLVQSQEPSAPVFRVEDAFGGDDGDDFFSQVENTDQLNASTAAPLERKSTSQILESMHFKPDEAIEDAIEEEQLDSEHFLENSENINIGRGYDEEPFEVETQEESGALEVPESKPSETDLAAKWKAMLDDDEFLDDDDELLPEDDEVLPTESQSIDPADLFGSDDEGFLEDDDDEPAIDFKPTEDPTPLTNGQNKATVHAAQPASTSKYTPLGFAATTSQPTNPYAPAPILQDLAQQTPSMITPAYGSPSIGNFQPPQQARPEVQKSQSFADKAKDGYSSPYDLPMEVVKPRKRPSVNQTPRGVSSSQLPGPPPRSSSMHSNLSTQSNTPIAPPLASAQPSQAAQTPQTQPTPTVRKVQSAFFEDLPMAGKPRQPLRHAASFQSPNLNGPEPSVIQPPPRGVSPYAPIQNVPQSSSLTTGLVAPERVSPYAPLPTGTAPIPPVASRYSPAPPHPSQSAPPPAVAQARYSPAPPVQRQLPPVASSISAPPPPLPHQPRTSSPLAHFERSHDPKSGLVDSSNFQRRSSSTYDSQLRTSHLPPTDELDENDPNAQIQAQPIPPPPQTMRHTPPPPRLNSKITSSPTRRVTPNYLPQPASNGPPTFAPPQRSQTQSPGAFAGARVGMTPVEPYQRPASVELSSSPRALTSPYAPGATQQNRPRGFSQGLNYIAPTDGREKDPLQRWRGAPVFVWGVGGTFVTSFPRDVPRYGIGQTNPMVVRSLGEVKIRSIKDVSPLPERLAGFPGPLKGKSKKKEVVAWLSTGIDLLEQDASYLQSSPTLSHDEKRVEERILLWKILRVFVENDGVLEGNPTVTKAVRDVLSPGLENAVGSAEPLYATGSNISGITASASGPRAEAVDVASVEALRKYLLAGEREKAVWEAVDKRLWAHALLISNTVSKELFKQVSQEFVQKEVRTIGHNTESLAALYDIFSGNFEESVDELVPPSARAGFQMISTSKVPAAKDALEGLDRWRETLGLVLSNRSPDDSVALNALGKLLAGYGRAEAAHICFLFARSHTVFGGIDDPAVNVVLIGADHLRQPNDFDKELEPILLSEVFEYAFSLSNPSSTAVASPHLAVYKLQHATMLAEYGYRDKAIQYCDAINSSITAQTRRSPYHHAVFTASLDDLYKRLKQSPKDESSSWISKPSMDKVGGSLLATFNKFVAGDSGDAASDGSAAANAAEVGPFARIAGGTPTISRSPSQTDFSGAYGSGSSNSIPIPVPSTKAASRYTPGGQYAPSSYDPQGSYNSQPRNSFEGRASNEYRREPQRQMSDYRPSSQHSSNYAPHSNYSTQSPYTPYSGQDGFVSSPSYAPQISTPVTEQPSSHIYDSPQQLNNFGGVQEPATYSNTSSRQPSSGFEPPALAEYQPSPSEEDPAASGYEPPSNSLEDPASGGYEPSNSSGYEPPSASGYEPPSSGYEPPAYVPYEPSDEPESPVDTRPKKKSFMDDDDDDDIPALKKQPTPAEKTKAEKDREADEAFRKAAEADAAKAAAAAPAKKGWGLSGWWGKKEASPDNAAAQTNKPIRAKLGEESSFYYDPELKRWVNKKAGADDVAKPAATPPPPRTGPPRSVSGSAQPPSANSSRPSSSAGPPQRQVSDSLSSTPPLPVNQIDGASPSLSAPPPLGSLSMSRSVSNGSVTGAPPLAPSSRPPSAMSVTRPSTGLSHSSSIDDLLGPAGLRKTKGAGAASKAKRKGRGYVDVMAAEKETEK